MHAHAQHAHMCMHMCMCMCMRMCMLCNDSGTEGQAGVTSDEDGSTDSAKNGLVPSQGARGARTSLPSASRRAVAEKPPNHVSSACTQRSCGL